MLQRVRLVTAEKRMALPCSLCERWLASWLCLRLAGNVDELTRSLVVVDQRVVHAVLLQMRLELLLLLLQVLGNRVIHIGEQLMCHTHTTMRW